MSVDLQADSRATTGDTPSLRQLLAPMEPLLSAVKDSLQAIIPPQTQVLAQTVQGSLTSGGKYLRPVTTLLIGRALMAEAATGELGVLERRLVEVAAVSEMIHIATLLHDDVIDEAGLRRGKPTVCAQLGNKVSILSGDYLLAQASLKLSKLDNTRLVAIYAQVLSDLCDGEVEQMTHSFDLSRPLSALWASYERKTYCKTASLFAAGAESAGVLLALDEGRIQALRDFGTSFGLAFQVADDLLDYTASEAELGKPVMDDLQNGLINAPVLLALESDRLDAGAKEDLKRRICVLFEADADTAARGEALAAIREALDRAEALPATRRLIARHTQAAIDAATRVLPDAPEKAQLIALVRHLVERRS